MEKQKNTLTVTDNRTGKTIEIEILNGKFIPSTAFKNLTLNDKDISGLCCYDPSFMNTAVASSKICYIDGENGILKYRGYSIEELTENCTFLEVAFLLIYGSLPTKKQYTEWERKVMSHTFIHENLISQMKTFRYDAHPMGMLISSVAALSTFYEEANPALYGTHIYDSPSMRNKQIFRILGKLPTIAACAYRHRIGRAYNDPVNHLSYTENFLYMMDKLSDSDYRPHPTLARVLDKMFIIHADHEMNCSTATMRGVASTLVDPYTAIAAASGALYGPLHGGANEQVLKMLKEIGDVKNIPKFIEEVKAKKKILYGFGHRIYKNYDPRAKLMQKLAKEVFEVVGEMPEMKIAMELEKQALADEYFIKRKLFPNVDFYSGLIYSALGFPADMFPVLFSIPRTAGWLAHWMEGLNDKDRKIYRPRQMYIGNVDKKFVPMKDRVDEDEVNLKSSVSRMQLRKIVSDKYFRNLKKNKENGTTTTNGLKQ